ncbi:transcriptional regulator [Paenibacillus popilliae ATCC 14706]|uniref:Transcriptional regulator n=1 Tax=Paenibacillus popilliae ATCC 14706 TaxID=1212764 RepID=M9LKA4_PAEPP|nr:transcriptional regulator [Paenibacillus popilliae ATCC 14706]
MPRKGCGVGSNAGCAAAIAINSDFGAIYCITDWIRLSLTNDDPIGLRYGWRGMCFLGRIVSFRNSFGSTDY